MTDELHRALPGYAHDDTFLELLAGVHVMATRFDALLEGYTAEPIDAPPVTDHEDLICALLGAIAIRAELAATLEHSARDSATVPEDENPELTHESLLR